MAGSSAPVMYWAVRNTLCIALRCQEVAIPNSDVARQEALNGAAVEPFEGPCQFSQAFDLTVPLFSPGFVCAI